MRFCFPKMTVCDCCDRDVTGECTLTVHLDKKGEKLLDLCADCRDLFEKADDKDSFCEVCYKHQLKTLIIGRIFFAEYEASMKEFFKREKREGQE